MFAALARFSYRRRWPVLIAFLVLFPVASVFGGGVFASLKSGGFDDPTAESIRAEARIASTLGSGNADLIALYTLPGSNAEDPAVRAAITAATDRAAADPAVARVSSFYSTNAPQFVSRDGTRTFAVLSLRGDDDEKEQAAKRIEPLLRADGLGVQFGGFVAVGTAINHAVESDLQRAEMIAFPITAVLLIVIFGSLVSAGVPLLLGGLAILLAFTTLRIITAFTDVSVFAANIVTVLGLGLAIDYSLFILNRYREELPARGVEGAIVAAISTTGRAVAFSGVTVAASLVGLFVFPQMFLRSMALGGIAVTLGAVIISITLLPALIAVLGHRIDALRLPGLGRARVAENTSGGFWHSLAFGVMRRPIVVAAAVVALLLLLGAPFLRFNGSTPDARVLGASVEARQVSDILDAEFLPHETTPHELSAVTSGPVLSQENIGKLYDYTQTLSALPGVTRVDSIFSIVPGLSKEAYQALYSRPAAEQDPALAAGLATFAQGNAARIAVVSRYEVDSAEGQAQVDGVRAVTPPSGVDVLAGGNAARLADLKDSIRERAPLMVAVIGAVMFVVLFLVFGSVTLPLKAMVMNLLSLTASYGAMVWIFQDGRLQGLLQYESLGTVDATQPILMFAIVFGLSMDYEVLLLSRVREEYNRTGDNALAVALGLEKTGRLITSAAALLVVVIGAFATSSMVFMKQLGVGMALAVAIDATIVRALLVPAAMRLMGRWNWWAPAPLSRLWQRAGLGDLEGHAKGHAAVGD
jgi:trehalose monomycolate/heme transporter